MLDSGLGAFRGRAQGPYLPLGKNCSSQALSDSDLQKGPEHPWRLFPFTPPLSQDSRLKRHKWSCRLVTARLQVALPQPQGPSLTIAQPFRSLYFFATLIMNMGFWHHQLATKAMLAGRTSESLRYPPP